MIFNTESPIDIAVRTAEGLQNLSIRWPTDEEWAARSRKRRIIIRRLGRGLSETIPPKPGEADVALYQAIAVNGAPPLTPAEAARILETIGTCEAVGVTVDGNEAEVELRIVTGVARHRLRIPTIDQVFQWRSAAVTSIDMPFNQQELRVKADPGARLYDACQGKSEDYQGPVPAIHKDMAVRAVIEYLDRELVPKADDANF